jgi:hypothetical protein
MCLIVAQGIRQNGISDEPDILAIRGVLLSLARCFDNILDLGLFSKYFMNTSQLRQNVSVALEGVEDKFKCYEDTYSMTHVKVLVLGR